MGYDINSIISQYSEIDDFGFSAVSEEEYNKVIAETADTAQEYQARLEQVEKFVIPYFQQLIKTADKEYIYWPNRKALVESQIQKILTLTRG